MVPLFIGLNASRLPQRFDTILAPGTARLRQVDDTRSPSLLAKSWLPVSDWK